MIPLPRLSTTAGHHLCRSGLLLVGLLLTPLLGLAPANAAGDSVLKAPAEEVRRYTLKQLGNNQAMLPLRTTDGKVSVTFGSRADELVTKALLRVRYTYSPALIAGQSHIKVALNEEPIGVINLSKENAGKSVIQEIALDPRFIADFNRLTLQFIGHYTTADCEDPLHSSLWADISGSSELELTTRRLAIKNDLALLPGPFFDARDNSRLNLPFVFANKPSRQTLHAAAVTSSWFGQLASWRGARFPAQLNQLPTGYAVVFATPSERPDFLADYLAKMPPIAAPMLSVITNPADGYSKLLLVLGRDGKDLEMAAQGLVLGNATLSGSQAVIREIKQEAPRQAYDAPNWVRLDRPMKFGELIASPQELQAFGHVPEALRINMRIPPDLFTWRSRGVPVDLKFRYSPPIRASESRLTMSINDELVQSFNLRASGQGSESRVRLPLLDDGLLGDSKEVFIPAFKLGSRNQLQYNFSFAYQKEGFCKDTQIENIRAMIDADSKVDFSGYPHYAEMPNLGYFATSGFPFTKYADLSQTVVVIPDNPNAYDIETLLTLLGHMGESTGHPATRVRLAGPGDESLFKDADLLLIGTGPQQTLLSRWGDKLPAMISGETRRISQPTRVVNALFDWLGFGTAPDPTISTQQKIDSNGPLAALFGFESPLSAQRSVVAVTAAAPEHLLQALDALDDNGLVRSMHGSVVFLRPQKADSILAGDTYTIGYLPIWTAIWFPLSEHPILLALMSVLAVLIFAFALWRSLKAVANRRLRDQP